MWAWRAIETVARVVRGAIAFVCDVDDGRSDPPIGDALGGLSNDEIDRLEL